MSRRELTSLLAVFLGGALCVWLAGCTSVGRTASGGMHTNKPDLGNQERLSEPPQISAEGKNADLSSGTPKSRYEVDVNTGDYRTNWWPGNPFAESTITPSMLSKEVRRLGLETPTRPEWKPARREPYVPGEMEFGYGRAVQVGGSLVDFLLITGASDDERRVVLAAFMKSLRTQPPAHVMNVGYVLIEKVLSQYGVDILNYYSDPSAFLDARAKLRDAVNRETGDNPK